MTYTFWHSGVLIGESDLEDASGNPGQHGGVFWPTAHGLTIFPRLTGILSAGHALKMYLDERGLSEDTMKKEEVEELFETTEAGRKIIDIGRMLSDVELRSPNGARLPFKSIAFTDLVEIRTVAAQLNCDAADEPVDVSPDTPRYLVSTTLRHPADKTDPIKSRGFRRTH